MTRPNMSPLAATSALESDDQATPGEGSGADNPQEAPRA
jgi:hypothetical protein